MAVSSASPPPGRKNSFRNPVTWVIILGVVVAGGAYLLWRRSQSSSSSGSSTTSGTTDTTGTSAADQTGVNDPGALGTLQTEIADLQSSEAQDSAAGTPAKSPGGGTTVSAPKVPPVITVVNPGTAAADISWTSVPGATGYQADVTGPSNSQLASPKVSTTHVRVSLPAGKKNLSVRVRAVNAAGNGPWSLPRTFNVGGTASKVPAAKKAA